MNRTSVTPTCIVLGLSIWLAQAASAAPDPAANPSQGEPAGVAAPAAAGAGAKDAQPPKEAGTPAPGSKAADTAKAGGAPVQQPSASPPGSPSATPAAAKAPAGDEAGRAQGVSAAMKELMDTLVEQGVLTRDKADAVLQKMDQRLQGEASRPPPPPDPNVIGVPYVPEFVKDDIREQLRKEMRQDVMKDVLAKAKKERWGLPGALPAWANRVAIYGDIRLRAQADVFASDNARNYYLNFLAINNGGGIGQVNYPFLDTNVNRYRMRLRGRLGLDAAITSRLKIGVMITTGNTLNPVTFNQDLGSYGTPFQVVWNKFFLRYQSVRSDGSPSLTAWGGRFGDPWLHSSLVWYDELDFQGIAAKKRFYFHGPAKAPDDPAKGHDFIFMTLAAVPIQNIQFTTNDKWLFGAQVGTDFQVQQRTYFKVGAAYYDYANISGKRNAFQSNLLDYTAPQFVQKGNTMYDIRNDSDPNTNLFALAADYRLVDVTAKLDFAQLAPHHVILKADYVKNVGYNEQQVFERTGQHIPAHTTGYQYEIAVGWPQDQIAEWGRWQIAGAYKYLQRDAVVDAFTDSNFHLGGTDTKGFFIRGEYGLATNTWMVMHWYSSNSIDGPPFGIDTLQLGLLAKF
ncbi:MAG TPA: putative porin [Gammaproteobacteria bacterium]|nr:putative porin [Gammaproteobacteria bacterium]